MAFFKNIGRKLRNTSRQVAGLATVLKYVPIPGVQGVGQVADDMRKAANKGAADAQTRILDAGVSAGHDFVTEGKVELDTKVLLVGGAAAGLLIIHLMRK